MADDTDYSGTLGALDTSSLSPMSSAQRDYQTGKDKADKQLDTTTSGVQQRLSTADQAIQQLMDSSNEAPPPQPQLQKLPNEPAKEPLSLFEKFVNPATFMLLVGTLMSKGNISMGMMAAGAAGEAWAKGRQEDYENKVAAWRYHMQEAVANNKEIMGQYKQVLDDKKLAVNTKIAAVRAIALANHDDTALTAVTQKGLATLELHLKNLENATMQMEKLSADVHEHEMTNQLGWFRAQEAAQYHQDSLEQKRQAEEDRKNTQDEITKIRQQLADVQAGNLEVRKKEADDRAKHYENVDTIAKQNADTRTATANARRVVGPGAAGSKHDEYTAARVKKASDLLVDLRQQDPAFYEDAMKAFRNASLSGVPAESVKMIGKHDPDKWRTTMGLFTYLAKNPYIPMDSTGDREAGASSNTATPTTATPTTSSTTTADTTPSTAKPGDDKKITPDILAAMRKKSPGYSDQEITDFLVSHGWSK